MVRGADLSARRVQSAIAYNRGRHHDAAFVSVLRTSLGMHPTGPMDEAFVRGVADWQEDHIGAGQGDGKIGPITEAHLNIQHPRAAAAATRAREIQRAGLILFDSWGNDVRDNDNDGVADGTREQTRDGSHYGRNYASFGVIAGTYTRLGWHYNRSITVSTTRTITGPFRYYVCADVVSRAYRDAGVMSLSRSTRAILHRVRAKGYVWRRSVSYPTHYLPGDFICTLGHGGGHSGIVVQREATSNVPLVVELPGPSTQVDLGTYNPASKNDVRLGRWTKAGVSDLSLHYLGRLLHSKMPP